MATTILEQIRQFHEDIEFGEKAASKLLAERSKKKLKFRPIYDHAIKNTLVKIQENSRRVLELYADKDGLRKEEIAVLGGKKRFNASGEMATIDRQDADDGRMVWLSFYDQLKTVKEHHRLNAASSDVVVEPDVATLAGDAVERCDVDKLFNADECLGRRVDMMSLFLEFTNLPKIRKYREEEFIQGEISRLKKRLQTVKKPLTGPELQTQLEEESKLIQFQEIDYITYLKIFDEFRLIPRLCKYRNSSYEKYLEHLLEYLHGFLWRLNPLTNHEKLVQHIITEFDGMWQKKSVPSWEVPTYKMTLFSLPTDHLFASEATLQSHMEGKKYKKALVSMQYASLEDQKKRIDLSETHDKSLAQMEYLIQRYKDILSGVIQRTVEHLQKKQSRSLREIEMEGEESDEEGDGPTTMTNEPIEEEESDTESDDGKLVYNPLNLPLGWDGKPIPFWLYKLHGLGIEFKCEICGNYSYWGRRAFERHFQEWRHAFGMRCLKIPNTVHFKEITEIEDAILLYEQLKREADSYKVEQDIECEDAEGNVMSARAYEDLRRQGLV